MHIDNVSSNHVHPYGPEKIVGYSYVPTCIHAYMHTYSKLHIHIYVYRNMMSTHVYAHPNIRTHKPCVAYVEKHRETQPIRWAALLEGIVLAKNKLEARRNQKS